MSGPTTKERKYLSDKPEVFDSQITKQEKLAFATLILIFTLGGIWLGMEMME